MALCGDVVVLPPRSHSLPHDTKTRPWTQSQKGQRSRDRRLGGGGLGCNINLRAVCVYCGPARHGDDDGLRQLGLELGDGLEEVLDEAVVRDLEDGRLGVLVDGDDRLRVLHT